MFKGKIVLVVDDESDLREILRDEFLYEGAEVMEAANGCDALELAKNHQFDIILSDIRMPGGDGVTLTRKLRELDPAKPVLVLITGFADLRSDEAFSLGADGYIPKPFRLEELKSTLSRLLKQPPERWLSPIPNMEKVRTLKVHRLLSEALRHREVQVGRGGFFLQMDPGSLRVGDLVRVHFDDFEALACVRWHRNEAIDDRRVGIGFEFLQMTPENFETLQQKLPQNTFTSVRSYIPAS